MKQNIQQLIIAATIILAAGNNCAVAQSNSTAISQSAKQSAPPRPLPASPCAATSCYGPLAAPRSAWTSPSAAAGR